MLKQLYRAIVMGSQASAARQTLPYLTDSHLNDMGFSRDTYIEGIQARISVLSSRKIRGATKGTSSLSDNTFLEA